MAELWLVRHGQTDWNIEGRFQGQADVPLNAAGRAEAQKLANELACVPFEAIYSSDLERARETAEIIAAPHELPVRVDERLREISHGDWEGLHVSEIRAQAGTAFLDPIQPRSPDFRSPGGESVRELAARVNQVLSEIERAHPNGPVLIVSHAMPAATLTCQARGIGLELVRSHIPRNCEPIRVTWPFSSC